MNCHQNRPGTSARAEAASGGPVSFSIPEGRSALPLISVILPFYNAEINLEEAVRSIVGQDYPDLEILLVDDVSTDGSARIAEELSRQDPRIRILKHRENQGAGPSRNTGVGQARGEFIFFLDSDDLLKPGALKLLHEARARERVDVVVGSCDQIDEEGCVSGHDLAFNPGCEDSFGLAEGEEAVRRWLQVDGLFLPVRPWGMLIRSSVYRDSGLDFSPGEHEDLTFTPFLYKYAGRVLYLRDIVVTYRIRQGSIINSPQDPAKMARYRGVWRDTVARLPRFGLEDYRREFKIFHLNHLLGMFEKRVYDRELLVGLARMIREDLNLWGEVTKVGDSRNLAFLAEGVCRLLKKAGREQDYDLWERFAGGLGAECLEFFIRKRITAISTKSWGCPMSNEDAREELLELKDRLSEIESIGRQREQEISELKAENERLRNKLVEVSFYLNSLLTRMDQRTALARNKRFRPTGLGLKTLGPAGIMKAVKRLPLIRGFREAPVIRLIKESGQFSPEFYRANYSDLAGYRGDLLLHFVRYGGYEGRSPNRHFDAKWYLNTNPGVERKGINPLYHFLKVGAVAGLWPSPDYDAREYLQLLENEGKGIE